MIGEIGDFFDRKMDHSQSELLKKLDYNRDELTELLNTVKKQRTEGKD